MKYIINNFKIQIPLFDDKYILDVFTQPLQNDIIHNSQIIDNIQSGLHPNDILSMNILVPYKNGLEWLCIASTFVILAQFKFSYDVL